MKSVFATSYFPNIGYLKAICSVENPMIDLGEHCKKQTERNRCSILTSNGIQNLSVPIIRLDGNKTSTKDILISNVEAWQRDHCRAITAAYAHSPYFEHYAQEVFLLIESKKEKLSELNALILQKIVAWFDLPAKVQFTDTYIDFPDEDYRNFQFQNSNRTYNQVEFGQNQFVPNLSILDALFCIGPMARNLIIEQP